MNNTESLLILNMLPKVGSLKARLLIQHFGSPEAVLEAGRSDLLNVNGIGDKIAESVLNWRNAVPIDEELEKIAAAGISIVSILDDDYPSNLKEIYDPPIVLYVKGKLDGQDKFSVALVGCRRATIYGKQTAQRLAFQLARNWFTVVSGLAYGIDTEAHRGALKAEGRTIAVIGSGFNKPYPPESVGMMEDIAKDGAVLSEFPMDTGPEKFNFPLRNRIISGLSLGVVVVEAPGHSGALITADHALSQNRLVFAVPGRIDAPTFKGNHKLIKQGAKLVETTEDILDEFDYLFPKKEIKKGLFEGEELKHPEMNAEEEAVFRSLSTKEKHIDEIILESGLTPTIVSAVLLQLEMKRLVRQLPGKLFVRSNLYQG